MLPWAEFWYNTAFQTSAGMTPFQALYGRKPPNIARNVLGSSSNDLIEQYMLRREDVLNLLKFNLSKAQTRMKTSADKGRTEDQFDEGDWVFVKLRPYRQHSLRSTSQHKFSMKYFGPYKVLKRVGMVAHKLELPEAARIHPVFHISLLKRCKGKPDQQFTPLQLEDSTTQNLEDKVLFSGGSNITNPTLDQAMDKEVIAPEVQVEEFGPAEQRRRSKRLKKPNKLLGDYIWQPG